MIKTAPGFLGQGSVILALVAVISVILGLIQRRQRSLNLLVNRLHLLCRATLACRWRAILIAHRRRLTLRAGRNDLMLRAGSMSSTGC